MSSHAEQDDHGIVKVWFTSPEFRKWKTVYPPIIFITSRPFPDLYNVEAITHAISSVLGHVHSNPSSKTMFTDLKTVIVIHPPTEETKQAEVEIIPLKDDLRAFRVIVAAYLIDAMPPFGYFNIPEPTVDDLYWLPPLPVDDKPRSDEEVFRTKHRNSDFNILTLLEDRERALQFFRWKRYLTKHVSANITSPGDVLECTTHEFDRNCHPPRGIYRKPIPQRTLQHMENILRPNPLSASLSSALNNSKRFTIKLGRVLADPMLKRDPITRIHLCHIEAIDGQPIEGCPELVMKIYDDRFMNISNPYNEDGVLKDDGNICNRYFYRGLITAEWHVRGELTAFEKMEMAQGSLIPYFYGAHKFRLANGDEVYGILMEYVDALPLENGTAGKWSEELRGQLMTSIRHGIRVLQYSDISQHDWHAGQILCNLLSSSPPQAHAVFIDFSATYQTTDPDIDHSQDDYGLCMSVISYSRIPGFDPKWVCEYWDRDEMKRESWDIVNMTAVFDDLGYRWSSFREDPYKFVYDGLD